MVNQSMFFQLMREERERQVAKGWTDEHDDRQSPGDWLLVLLRELGCISDPTRAPLGNPLDPALLFKRGLVKLASVCMAAYLALERRNANETQHDTGPRPASEATGC